MLETWRSQSATALRKVEDRIEDQTRSLNQQSRFLEEIEAEIDSMREQFVDRLPRHPPIRDGQAAARDRDRGAEIRSMPPAGEVDPEARSRGRGFDPFEATEMLHESGEHASSVPRVGRLS